MRKQAAIGFELAASLLLQSEHLRTRPRQTSYQCNCILSSLEYNFTARRTTTQIFAQTRITTSVSILGTRTISIPLIAVIFPNFNILFTKVFGIFAEFRDCKFFNSLKNYADQKHMQPTQNAVVKPIGNPKAYPNLSWKRIFLHLQGLVHLNNLVIHHRIYKKYFMYLINPGNFLGNY